MIWRCDLVPQYERYQEPLRERVHAVGMSGRYILAQEGAAFEKEFAAYLGVRRVVGVANGTDALMLIMQAMGIGQGDEVITTPYTAIPTASAIVAVGATPVFVDIDPETFLMDISQVASAITSRTKAIMPVHIFGNVLDVDALKRVAGDIPVIEDACQAHGSTILGKRAGSLGYASAFSFYPTKNLGGYGDGGAIATNDEAFADKLIKMRMYGMVDKDHIVMHGINTRLDEIQAAILRVKLKDLDQDNARRLAIAERYRSELTLPGITHQKIDEHVSSNYHVYTVRFKGDRARFIQYLEEFKIQTNIYYLVPLHLQEANRYLGYAKGALPASEQLCDEALAITMYPELKDETLDYVIKTMNSFGG